jgi:hypothetical protein
MNLFSKWLAAGLVSTTLLFSGTFAEAKPKHAKSHKAHATKKAKKKHQAARGGGKKSANYAKASGYMGGSRSPASVSHAKKKKHVRKHRS